MRSYYHPNFTHSGAESHVPTTIPSPICSKAALETFHALCSVPAYSHPLQAPGPPLASLIPAFLPVLLPRAPSCPISLPFPCQHRDHFPSGTYHPHQPPAFRVPSNKTPGPCPCPSPPGPFPSPSPALFPSLCSAIRGSKEMW